MPNDTASQTHYIKQTLECNEHDTSAYALREEAKQQLPLTDNYFTNSVSSQSYTKQSQKTVYWFQYMFRYFHQQEATAQHKTAKLKPRNKQYMQNLWSGCTRRKAPSKTRKIQNTQEESQKALYIQITASAQFDTRTAFQTQYLFIYCHLQQLKQVNLVVHNMQILRSVPSHIDL